MVSELLGDVTRRQADGLERDLRDRVDGEVRFDAGTRGAYSTDASNFRQVPIGVVLPRTPEAAVEAVAVCRGARRPGPVPRRRHQPGGTVHQRRGDAGLVEVLPPRSSPMDEQERTCIGGAGHCPGCPQRKPVGAAASASALSLRLI